MVRLDKQSAVIMLAFFISTIFVPFAVQAVSAPPVLPPSPAPAPTPNQMNLQQNMERNLGAVQRTSFLRNPPGGAIGVAVNILQLLLGLIGIIFLIMVILGGFQWMTAGGNADQVKQGRDRIVNGVVGLVIIFFSLSLISFLFGILTEAGDLF